MKSANICLICKGGRALCGNVVCPLLPRFNIKEKAGKISKEFFGPSHNVFIGRVGYPNISVGPLTSMEENVMIDSPQQWFGMPYENIVELRSMLIRSKHGENIKSKSRFVNEIQELAAASKPTDTEISFKKEPKYSMIFSDMIQPMGPSAELEKMKITENVSVTRTVEKIVGDEIKANASAQLLYKSGEDVYKITTILSSGILGYDDTKKLVPTRWSITAIDDIIAKHLIDEVKQYSSINEYYVFSSEYLSNHFEILLMPGNWEFENFEAWSPGSLWARGLKKPEILEEYEPNSGRKEYAELQGGGYYASRLAVTEALSKMKRQARVIAFREISEGYVIPLGVWVVRETVRNAFRNSAKKFATLDAALKHISTKLRLPINEYVKQSRILKQKRLWDFKKSMCTI